MSHVYSEDQLVEQPAVKLFAAMGWRIVSALEETFGLGGTLGRETKGEGDLVSRLRAALERLNPSLPPEALSGAIDQLIRDRSVMSLAAANREVYGLLKDGIPVSVQDDGGGQSMEQIVHPFQRQTPNPRRTRDLLLSGTIELPDTGTLATQEIA